MSMTSQALKNPSAVAVAIAIVTLFGIVTILKLPIQLFPDIDQPSLAIETVWRAASPQEVESEILEPQEDVLRGLPGLDEMQGNAGQGSAYLMLTFELGTDMQQTLIDVISRLNRVPPLPDDADPPIVEVGSGSRSGNEAKALSWFYIQLLPGNPNPIEYYADLVDDVVRPRIESVPGVASVYVSQPMRTELWVEFDPYKAAELGIGIGEVARLAGRANDISGGFVDVGRRQYTVRFAGRYSPDELQDLILEWRDGKPVYLRDIADVRITQGDRMSFAYQNGNPAISIRVDRLPGVNLLATLEAVKAEMTVLNETVLAENSLNVEQSFDASVFIYRAITLVTNNIVLGALLAIGVLWWFLRRLRATLIIALAIPTSLLSTFVVLGLAERSLNVISLAGLAFAVGMVLDAAIVALENIVRLRSEGRPAEEAAEQGTSQVWGALLASTATTVAIFLPVIFIDNVEGQLFADLALTISIAVIISLFVATIVLPAAAVRFLEDEVLEDQHADTWKGIARTIIAATDTPARRYSWMFGLMVGPIAITVLLFPNLDYLPPVKRDSVDGFYNLPAGASVDATEDEIVKLWVERLDPYLSGEKEPKLKNYFINLFGPFGGMMGARVEDQSRVKELERIMRTEITAGIPDLQIFLQQGNLFGNFDGGRQIVVNLQARDQEQLMQAAVESELALKKLLPGAQIQVFPSLELAQPELRLVPRDREIIEAGWSRTAFGLIVRALGDGLYIGEHFDGDKRMNIILRSLPWQTPEELGSIPLATPSGKTFHVNQLVDITRTVGPSQISRVDGRRTIGFAVAVPETVSLQEYMEKIRNDFEPMAKSLLPDDGSVVYRGSASDLADAILMMTTNFTMALFILLMLMAALFRSLKDSLLVMLSIPLATVGSVLMLRFLNIFTFQPLDLLTMIGFIILLGLVVNNAILLVHQTRSAERGGLDRRDAVEQALRLRSRPIFMSTLTSIFGMLPLLLLPGTGSVIYRGLAATIVGGMCVSTVFTMILLPCLLRLGEGSRSYIVVGAGAK